MSNVLTIVTDSLLVSAAQSGDYRAFAELCNRHSRNGLPQDLPNHEELGRRRRCVSGISSEAFVHLMSFEGRSGFSPWFTRIAINSALMLLPRRRRLEIPIDRRFDDPKPGSTGSLRISRTRRKSATKNCSELRFGVCLQAFVRWQSCSTPMNIRRRKLLVPWEFPSQLRRPGCTVPGCGCRPLFRLWGSHPDLPSIW